MIINKNGCILKKLLHESELQWNSSLFTIPRNDENIKKKERNVIKAKENLGRKRNLTILFLVFPESRKTKITGKATPVRWQIKRHGN